MKRVIFQLWTNEKLLKEEFLECLIFWFKEIEMESIVESIRGIKIKI